MAKEQITEIVQVKVKSTEDELRQVISGNPIIPLAKLLERYRKTKESFLESGYVIVSEDIDKQSFVAEKKYQIDDKEE